MDSTLSWNYSYLYGSSKCKGKFYFLKKKRKKGKRVKKKRGIIVNSLSSPSFCYFLFTVFYFFFFLFFFPSIPWLGYCSSKLYNWNGKFCKSKRISRIYSWSIQGPGKVWILFPMEMGQFFTAIIFRKIRGKKNDNVEEKWTRYNVFPAKSRKFFF